MRKSHALKVLFNKDNVTRSKSQFIAIVFKLINAHQTWKHRTSDLRFIRFHVEYEHAHEARREHRHHHLPDKQQVAADHVDGGHARQVLPQKFEGRHCRCAKVVAVDCILKKSGDYYNYM